MAVPVHKLRLLPLAFATLLMSVAATSFSQAATQTASTDANASVREANALLTLQHCYDALGGDSRWQAHTSASVRGKITMTNVDHQIFWADDWSGGSLKSRREYSVASNTIVSTADSAHGVQVRANGQTTQSDNRKLTDLAPVHLPAILLQRILADSASSVKTVVNTNLTFPNDQQVEVQTGSNTFSKQEWWFNTTSRLPDQIITYTSGSRHPNRPEPLTIRYVGFVNTQGSFVPSVLETDLGAIHLHVALTSVTFDTSVSTTP